MTELRKDRLVNELMYNTMSIHFPVDNIESISEDNILTESMVVKQSICDDDNLRVGGCIASELTIGITSTEARKFFDNQYVGKLISVVIVQTAPTGEKVLPSQSLLPSATLYPNEYIGDDTFYVFSGYIDSFVMDKQDSNSFTLTAYDVFSKMYRRDASQWFYKNVIIDDTMTLWQVFSDCLEKFSVTFNESAVKKYFNEKLADNSVLGDMHIFNDKWKTSSGKVTYGQIIKDICEMLGLFGFIKPNSSDGEFVLLDPFDSNRTEETYTFYEELSIDANYKTRFFGEIIIAQSEKTSTITPDFITSSSDNSYDMTDNVMVYMRNSSDGRLNVLWSGDCGKRITGYGRGRSYPILTATLDGRLWVNIGDYLRIRQNITDVNGDYVLDEDGEIETIDRVVPLLSRTIKGIQALTDYIETKG